MPLSGEVISVGLAAIGAVVWLVRLEGRVNANDKLFIALERDLAASNVRFEEESKAHRSTADALIRVEEQLKYVREFLERHLEEPPLPRRRRPGGTAS